MVLSSKNFVSIVRVIPLFATDVQM